MYGFVNSRNASYKLHENIEGVHNILSEYVTQSSKASRSNEKFSIIESRYLTFL